MVALDTAVAWKIAVAFNFACMAWITCFGLARLPFCSNNRVNLGLWEVGYRSGGSGGHVGAGCGGRE